MNIPLSDLITALRSHADPRKAGGMEAYMKHRFPFLGLQKAPRLAVTDPFLKEKCRENAVDWDLVSQLWDQPEREFQYTALNYLWKMKRQLGKADIPRLKALIESKSWWDTVDSIALLIGEIVRRHPEVQADVLTAWIQDPDLWVKRVSILFQLKYKRDTDTAFLSKAILANCTTKEFFLNKAIGWALREYSKTDPDWVRHFLSGHTLHPLSLREGGKYC
ncbi:MAG: DNA alkylation repair protein [Candidatus Marinimicrobia bacterium]|nr:DNA alkylation repair protein [Candidatus Neomarinimicrobiota bacterium]